MIDEPQDDENCKIARFAEADCDMLDHPQKTSTFRITAKRIALFPVKFIGYLAFLPLWPQRLTLSEIRMFRETVLPNQTRKRYHCGIMPYYFINWLTWHVYRHIKKLDLDINDGKHAWEIIKNVWSRTIASKDKAFFALYEELRPRSFEDFINRDKTFFLRENGNIFSKESREALYYVLLLSHRGNKFIRLLYSYSRGLVVRKKIQLDKLSRSIPIAAVLFEDCERRMMQIKNIRRECLERIETYATNMLRDTVDQGSTDAATGWNEVICRVRELKGFRPMTNNLGHLAALVREMVEHFNDAAKRTYVSYLQSNSSILIEQTTAEPLASEPMPEDGYADPPIETKVYGRFRIELTETHYRIIDTIQDVRPYKIKKGTNAGDAVRQLMLTYKTGTDQTHPSSRTWNGAFQSGRGDATRFKNDQIFMLPRWNAEKHEFMLDQYASRWRLWMDSELSLPKKERVQRFIANHPNGLPN